MYSFSFVDAQLVVSDLAEHGAALKMKLWVLKELAEANTVHSAKWQQLFITVVLLNSSR